MAISYWPLAIGFFVNSLFCVSQLTPRLSREQRLLADFAEAERGRVAEGKPMANG
ncbi:MAG: hypothetical protein II281_07560 [Alistipes sp.]|nr:hypothetical protein [Alistipes sp.]